MFYGVDEQTKFLSKTVSRTHIAQLCGATLESTVRALKELEKDGFISLHKKDIRIENRQRLAELAGIHF
jgi:CRP-like cAMP-binding protein